MKTRAGRVTIFSLVFLMATASLSLVVPSQLDSETRKDAATVSYEQGKRLQEMGKYDEAIDLFRKATKERRNYADAYFAMGVSHYKLNQADRAIASFNEVLRINPASAETHNNLAVIYAQQGDYDSAARQLKETLRLNPDYQQGHLNLADLYLAQSIQEYLKVIRAGKDDRSEARVRAKVRRLLQSDTQDPDFQYHLGILNRVEGNTDQAIQNLNNAASLDPSFTIRARLELGDLYEETGKLDKAFAEYSALAKMDPNHFAAAHGAGRVKTAMGDYESAESYLTRAREIRPSAAVDYELGKTQKQLGRLDAAAKSYRRSLGQQSDPQVRFALAEIYKEQKAYTKALREFEAILETHPDQRRVERAIRDITRMRLAATTPVAAVVPAEPTKATQTIEDRPELLPAPLAALEREGDYALLVDKSKQTLLLYQNQNGRVSHVSTYACSTGENSGEKLRVGDKKTPEGIYQFTELKSEAELQPEYGKMAFPMDYPNLFDVREGKNGNGIWLHSTNEPLRAFLPNKTRGCVVVSNEDIVKLAEKISLFETPIVVHEKIDYVTRSEQDNLRREVLGLLEGWEQSWEAKDVSRFIGFYASAFTSGKMDLQAWRKYKRRIFKRTKEIDVALTPFHILKHDQYVIVSFLQEYQADRYSDTGIKRLFLVRENNQWRILGEEWRAA